MWIRVIHRGQYVAPRLIPPLFNFPIGQSESWALSLSPTCPSLSSSSSLFFFPSPFTRHPFPTVSPPPQPQSASCASRCGRSAAEEHPLQEFQPLLISDVAHISSWRSRLPSLFLDDSGRIQPPFPMKPVLFEQAFNDIESLIPLVGQNITIGK